MINFLKIASISALVLLFVGDVSATPVENAPTFSASDINGKNFSSDTLKGKWVVLEWFNPECPFVRKHYDSKNMQTLQKKWTEKGVVWLTIDSAAPGKQGNLDISAAKEVASEKGMNSTGFILDPEGTIGRAFGAKTTPAMFVINPEGKLVFQGAIDDRPSTSKSDIEGANNYVDNVLTQGLGGKEITVASTESYGCSVKYDIKL